MLIETYETLSFFVTFLSFMTFQLRGPDPWLRLWMITLTNHVIVRNPRHFGDFRNIFLQNVDEDQNKY